jgi:peptidyl-prolyl cis-trans isomerase D
VKLTADKFKAESQPTLQEMQQNYDLNKAQYMTPERRSLVVLVADQAKIEATVNPTDADLQRAYTQNLNNFRIPETVKVRHILFMTQGKPASEDAKMKAQADDVLKQVKAGGNFAELAKKYSEDPGSKNTGGEYSVQKNGQMVPEFEAAAFRLKPGESEVVKTAIGYHVVQVMQHDQARVKPFDEVKAQLAADWKKQRVNDLMQQISDKAQAMLQKEPADKVAAELNMQLVKVDNYEQGKPVPEVGISGDFDQAVTGLRKGEVSQPVALQGNRIAIAQVLDVFPPHQASFADVQNTIKETIATNRAAGAVRTHAQELVDKAKAMGGDLAKAAKSMGLEVKTSDEVTRTGAIEGLGSASYIADAFTKPDGSVVGPIATPDATVVAKVVSKTQADVSKLTNDERAKLRDEIKSRKGRDRGMLFEAGLREALIQQGKIKIHEDVIKRLIAQYQGA